MAQTYIQNWVLLLFSFLFVYSIQAQETKVMVRVKAKDAKFIGSSVGGAEVFIKEVESGKILANGITSGGTGNTDLIMKKSHERRKPLSDEETAGFLAKLNLEKPTFVEISAKSPANAKQAHNLSSTQVWVIPGKDILGDGIILEAPGFIVDILSPQRHNIYPTNSSLEIKTNIVMMCGCPITPGGIWNADDYEVKAIIQKDGKKFKELKMDYSGKPNTFSSNLKAEPGLYEITVYAYDSTTGNTGVDKTNIIIQ